MAAVGGRASQVIRQSFHSANISKRIWRLRASPWVQPLLPRLPVITSPGCGCQSVLPVATSSSSTCVVRRYVSGDCGSNAISSSTQASLESQDEAERERLIRDFMRTLRQPANRSVRGSEARGAFNLTREDLSTLQYFTKESPYEPLSAPFKQYSLPDVVELALRKHGEDSLVIHFSRMVTTRLHSEPIPSQYGNFPHGCHPDAPEVTGDGQGKFTRKKYWYNAPSTSTVEGRQSVLQGLWTNIGICSIKGSVWWWTGSHVVFADLMHSFADVANYSYRLAELNRSARTRDVKHPYGYAPLRYITADRSFVFLFFVGGVCPLMIGLQELVAAQAPLPGHVFAPALVFALSAILEGKAVQAAYREILSQAAKEKVEPVGKWPLGNFRNVHGYLLRGRDIMSTATFTEACSGVVGAGVGLCGLGTSYYLQSAVPDITCSILMGAIVCGVSSFLLRRSGNALLGQTLPSWRVKALVSRLEAHDAVVGVYDVKTEMLGTDTVRFKAEVQFHPESITERILQAGIHGTAAKTPSTSGQTLSTPHGDAYRVLSTRLQCTLQGLDKVAAETANLGEPQARTAAIAPWLFKNNQLFYEALVWELKDAERILRVELGDFKNVHIDLEPW